MFRILRLIPEGEVEKDVAAPGKSCSDKGDHDGKPANHPQ
jgi:hypothetical protein